MQNINPFNQCLTPARSNGTAPTPAGFLRRLSCKTTQNHLSGLMPATVIYGA
jgi:hypothetical protein